MPFEQSFNLPKYYKNIRDFDPLTIEEERELLSIIKSGDGPKALNATHSLVKHNLKIVIRIANRHIGQGLSIDDLIQEGNIGLLEAAENFEPVGDMRFINYAQLWVRKRINEAVAKNGRTVRRPHNVEYKRYLKKKKGETVANLINIDLNAPMSEDSDITYGDTIGMIDEHIDSAHNSEEYQYYTSRALKVLKERDRIIIKLYYGIDEDFRSSPENIAQRFGMTNIRICQIIKESLHKMQKELNKIV